MKALILTACLGIVAMVSEIFGFRKYIWLIVVLGLAGIFAVNINEWNTFARYYNDMVFIDNYAIAFTSLLLSLALIWFFISKDQYENEEFNSSDHYALVLFSLVGAFTLVSYSDLSMLFLGIEILSIPMYILAGSRKKDLASNEAAMKYFMMGAFATGLLLFGIALVYGATGTFNLEMIAQYTEDKAYELPDIFYPGVLLITIGLCFKVSAVPFHFWAPDVYEGSPLFITAFMATIVKTAAFGAFYRLYNTSFQPLLNHDFLPLVLSVITALTILTGNILAVYQNNAKRMLAYSGIAQAGYLFLNLLVLNDKATNSLWFYAASYGISTLSVFAVVYWVIRIKGNDSFDSFNALGKSHPLLAFVLSVSLISLAGIPPAIGFFAKFYLFTNALQDGHLALVIIAIVGSMISVFYYFKLIIAMYSKESVLTSFTLKFGYQTVLVLLVILIITFGILPGYLINIIPE
jgi:NADH-quinone oxidoreductase subunit N